MLKGTCRYRLWSSHPPEPTSSSNLDSYGSILVLRLAMGRPASFIAKVPSQRGNEQSALPLRTKLRSVECTTGLGSEQARRTAIKAANRRSKPYSLSRSRSSMSGAFRGRQLCGGYTRHGCLSSCRQPFYD
jgi:hypothetical protein